MKTTSILLILAISFYSFSIPETKTTNKLSQVELKFVKENYYWNDEGLIIINFRQPQGTCHYDNYKNLKQSSQWFMEFYSKMKLDNVRNIFVYSEGNRSQEVIDSKSHYPDVDNFFLDNFFGKEQTCFGILVINKDGEFQKKSGEYTQEDILNLMNKSNKS